MACDLDPINMICWTHGVAIDENDYLEGSCSVTIDECDDDDDELEDY